MKNIKDKFTITISDINGSKHYMLNQIIKRFFLYFTLFIVFLIVSGSYLISFLMDNVDELEIKKNSIIHEQELLKRANNELVAQINSKSKQYDIIKEKITNIEELIGITPTDDIEVDERLKNMKFTSSQQKEILNSIPNGAVVPFKGCSGKFGWRIHPILKKREFHRGIDLRAKKMTPVTAPADGVVEYAAYHKGSGFGYLVIVDHGYGFKTTYAHLSKKFPFKTGSFIKKGEIIAYTGSSGLSTGPHLHYEVRFITRPLNPQNFMDWNRKNFTKIFKKEKRVSWQSLIKIMQKRLHLTKQQS